MYRVIRLMCNVFCMKLVHHKKGNVIIVQFAATVKYVVWCYIAISRVVDRIVL